MSATTTNGTKFKVWAVLGWLVVFVKHGFDIAMVGGDNHHPARVFGGGVKPRQAIVNFSNALTAGAINPEWPTMSALA